jgi:uncharacterized membrane protein
MHAAAPVLTASGDLSPSARPPRSRGRIESVDLLRGLLMILMALDHTRDYFTRYTVDPVDPMHSWPALFITRWITHLCAPGFIALAGASVYLQRQRGKTSGQLARLLFTRGLWLIFLEFTVISFGWSFSWAPFLQVIWAIGIAMVCLSALMRLSTTTVGAIGATIILLHNLLDPIRSSSLGRFADLWILVHEPGVITWHGHAVVMGYYPALPWVGVICLGYAFGPVVTAGTAIRSRITLGLSATFLAAFALLRATHSYGDPIPFRHLSTPSQTAMSFLDVQKYPPSLEYVLATFGVLLLLFTLFDTSAVRNWLPRARNFLETYGRVPFFYYVLHIYLLHTIALLWTAAVHNDWHFWLSNRFIWGGETLSNWGYSLPVVYAIWIAVVLLLYRPCVWFSRLKQRRRDWWLSYL